MDAATIARARSGDDAAIVEVLAELDSMLRGVAWGIVKHDQDAEDVLSEAWVQILRALRDGRYEHRGDGEFVKWCIKIVANAAKSAWRQRDWRRCSEIEFSALSNEEGESVVPEVYGDPLVGPEAAALADDGVSMLLRAVGMLRPQYQAMILMWAAGANYEEIATRMGWPIGSVRSGMNVARGHLLRHWRAMEGNGE
jgi:RNA polymerase sigma-70 factor (ECF subfamily)